MAVSEVRKEEKLNLESITFGELTWINIEGPTENETQYLAERYPFHPLDLDDCISRIQRAKIDEYPDYLFLVLHFPVFNREARVTVLSQVSVFIGEKYLITLHKGELKPLVKLFVDCQIDEESRQEYFSQGSGYLLYRIIDRLVDYCLPILNRIGHNIEQVEDEVFARESYRVVREISVLRRDVIAFRRTIWPMRAVINSLEPKLRRFTKMELAVYFGDVVDHVDKIWDGLDEYKEIIEGLSDTHDSLATNSTNEVVRVLTILATVLMGIAVVPSIYGMNIPLPFQDSDYAFVYLIVIIIAIIGGMLYYFHRQHWI